MNHRQAEVATKLNSAAIHLLRGLSATDRLSGLTGARLSALSVVVFGGPCTLRELADAEGVTSPTMSRVVDGHVEPGLAHRTQHPDSARKILVTATDEGHALMQAARQRRVDVISAALDELPAGQRRAITQASSALLALAQLVPRTGAR